MKILFWLAGLSLVPLAGATLFYFSQYVATGEPVPLVRAKRFYRWCVVVVLGTFDIWIFVRVLEGIRALLH